MFPDKIFFILGDTPYGDCCVDEVNGEHLNADLIIHFGHFCASENKRINTIFFLDEIENFRLDISILNDFKQEETLFIGDSELNPFLD